jgi:hypothetical protein
MPEKIAIYYLCCTTLQDISRPAGAGHHGKKGAKSGEVQEFSPLPPNFATRTDVV